MSDQLRQQDGGRFAIVGAHLLDEAGGRRRCRVEVAGEHIVSVTDDAHGAPYGETDVDARGMTLLPGLIDAHIHLADAALAQGLAFGVTTQLDMSSDERAVGQARDDARSSTQVSDVRSALTGATVPDGHPIPLMSAMGLDARYPTVRTPEEARTFVAGLAARGADYLKIFLEAGDAFGISMPTLDDATCTALAETAHAHGLLAVAHVTSWDAARRAMAAGIDGLAHLPVDGRVEERTLSEIVDTETFVVPTLTMIESLCGLEEGRAASSDPLVVGHLGPQARATLRATWPMGPLEPGRLDAALASVRTLHEAGVPVLAGTDALTPGTAHGVSLHRELALLVRAGMSPAEAVTAASRRTAEVFGLSDRGRVDAGLRADLLLVRGDLAADVGRSLDVAAIWRGGQRVDRDRLAIDAGATA